jgi:arginyl-tRNA synthetase
VGTTQTDKFGDYQANAAMGLAKTTKSNPRAVAEKIKEKLDLGEMASEISIAGPGFLNVRLAPVWVAKQLSMIVKDDRLGVERVQKPQTVVVDYSGPNVAKQMHVGHLRSTIIGDAISRVIEFQGHAVIRQNHIGDWGTQFGMLIAFLKASGKTDDSHISDLEDFYRQSKKRFDEGSAFADEARKTVVRLQGGGAAELAAWRKIVDETWLHFMPVYQRLGVKLRGEDARGESFYNPMLASVVRDLREAGLAKESEGATVVFNEGFENPLLIEKTGGGYLYSTTDLAAIRYRIAERHANRIIYTHDSRQAQHFAQVFATAKAAGWAMNTVLEYAPFGTMLGEDQKPFKSRSGELIKLKDLLDEAEERAYKLVTEKNAELSEQQRREIAHAVGIGGVKYSDLSKDRISDYVFSWDKMLALDGNTAPYLQYAYARTRSIFRKSGIAPDLSAKVSLDTPFELTLGKHILRFGEVIEIVARELKPHHLTSYLYELATKFSAFYENCPVLQAEESIRASRLVLCEATARTLAMGLELLGIEHPEQM